ncbi:MAG TPA: HAMP domain-containing sensor histidine kinase [Acidobacteriaceae bacterium]|nr:HAMP domain-containing sensor histidine kinase [Acidobacteriaceae bacterium]
MSASSLMPHAVCWRADQHLIWTMVVSNAITFLSYTTICVTLLTLRRRTSIIIARDWVFFLTGFALFIVACGTTHLMEVVTTWSPIFWADAWTNILTAVFSAYVTLQLIRRLSTITSGINDYAARLARTEDEKAQLQENLLAAQKLEDWSRMSAVVTHEIGNPLEAIQNILYLIRQSDAATPEVVRLTRMASAEADRVLTISRSTLSFFRQSSRPERVDLRAAAESVRFLLDPVLRRREITLNVRVSGDVAVEAIAGEARQVLLNLVRNACEASPRGGSHVTLTLSGQADHVDIIVTDEGSGIDPAVLPTIFQFGQTTKGSQGNGMGLWTVKHIVDRHGGKIHVDSTPGHGATFTITWPRHIHSNSPHQRFTKNLRPVNA